MRRLAPAMQVSGSCTGVPGLSINPSSPFLTIPQLLTGLRTPSPIQWMSPILSVHKRPFDGRKYLRQIRPLVTQRGKSQRTGLEAMRRKCIGRGFVLDTARAAVGG